MNVLKRSYLAVLVAVLLLVVASCGSNSTSVEHEKPDRIAVGHWWPFHFDTLEEMVATSDLVVVGEVTAIARGPVLTDDPDGIAKRLVTLTISETLKGATTSDSVIIEESGYDSYGSFEVADMPWSRLGDKGVFSLKHYEGHKPNHFSHVHPDGRMLTHYKDNQGNSQAYENTVKTFSHTTLGETLATFTPANVVNQVKASVVRVVNEQIEPQRPFQESIFNIDPNDPDVIAAKTQETKIPLTMT